MRPIRDAKIVESSNQVAVSTFPSRPIESQFLFILSVIPWFGLGVFSFLIIFSTDTQDSKSWGEISFLTLWILVWLAMGIFQWPGFLRAFSNAEIVANGDGLRVVRTFPLGQTTKMYSWNKIEYISHYFTTNRPYGGVVLRAGRWLTTIDSRLSTDTAERICAALLSVSPKN